MQLRTDGKFAYREDTIESIAEFYDRNKTESLMRAADDVPELVRAITRALERDDLTHEQRCELADALSTRHFDFSFAIEDGDIVTAVRAE